MSRDRSGPEPDERTATSAQSASRLALWPLIGLQRLLNGSLENLGSIAQAARLLPEINQHLASIAARVDSLDGEVARMRKAVEDLRQDVRVVREAVDPLDQRLREVRQAFERLEPELTDIGLAVRPLRRARARFGGGAAGDARR
jgi:chromosome segregation ATPase